MSESGLVSIVMPAYNAEKYIEEAIQSVINQSYNCWELLIVNDGSEDHTEEIIQKFTDPRIKYFKQNNQGVSAARNTALLHMKGSYLCFLDADDVLPVDSITVRIQVFLADEQVAFVDGSVRVMDHTLTKVVREYKPKFVGNPYQELLKLSEACFFGPSWMIRVEKNRDYQFPTDMTHSEDLYFYLSISKTGIYKFVEDTVLLYRTSSASAMNNLRGLERGYQQLYLKVKHQHDATPYDLLYLKLRAVRITVLSYILLKKDMIQAVRAFFRFVSI